MVWSTDKFGQIGWNCLAAEIKFPFESPIWFLFFLLLYIYLSPLLPLLSYQWHSFQLLHIVGRTDSRRTTNGWFVVVVVVRTVFFLLLFLCGGSKRRHHCITFVVCNNKMYKCVWAWQAFALRIEVCELKYSSIFFSCHFFFRQC